MSDMFSRRQQMGAPSSRLCLHTVGKASLLPCHPLTSNSASWSVSRESHSSRRCSLPLVVSLRTNHCGAEEGKESSGMEMGYRQPGDCIVLRLGETVSQPEEGTADAVGLADAGQESYSWGQ